jgi:hypothetical protein|tara:strand:- start:1457 stop:1909 length:453 start_codon:yes stop_codon:yes gene_type:complete
MTYIDILLLLSGLFLGVIIWLPIYKIVISKWVGDSVVKRCESGEIDLRYLLDEGGVFEELTKRIVVVLKQNMLAEMGQLTRASKTSLNDLGGEDAISAGLNISNDILKAVGVKKPPAFLTYKLAQTLGQLTEGAAVAQTPPIESVDLEFI